LAKKRKKKVIGLS